MSKKDPFDLSFGTPILFFLMLVIPNLFVVMQSVKPGVRQLPRVIRQAIAMNQLLITKTRVRTTIQLQETESYKTLTNFFILVHFPDQEPCEYRLWCGTNKIAKSLEEDIILVNQEF
jgi:hypothetical protein